MFCNFKTSIAKYLRETDLSITITTATIIIANVIIITIISSLVSTSVRRNCHFIKPKAFFCPVYPLNQVSITSYSKVNYLFQLQITMVTLITTLHPRIEIERPLRISGINVTHQSKEYRSNFTAPKTRRAGLQRTELTQ